MLSHPADEEARTTSAADDEMKQFDMQNDLAALRELAANHRKLFLICRSGRMSLVAADALLKEGVGNVWNVTGGMQALKTGADVHRA